MVETMLAARGICVTYETARQWGKKFGKAYADRIRQPAPVRGDKWRMDDVVVSIAGEKPWLWRAVDQNGFVLDVLIQRRRDTGSGANIENRAEYGLCGSTRITRRARHAKFRQRFCS